MEQLLQIKKQQSFIYTVERVGVTVKANYIPHHLIKKYLATTPIWVVYNCSYKQSRNSPGLDDCLSAVSLFLTDLYTILLCFWLDTITLSADIENLFSMYII